MGLLSLIKDKSGLGSPRGGSLGTAQTGECTITAPDQLLGVDQDAITPQSPGEFSIFRSVPGVKKPGYLTQSEANLLGLKAEELKVKAKAAVQAYEHLKSIKNSDTKVHGAFNNYRVHEARKTLTQVRSNAEAGNAIAALSSKYAALHQLVGHRLEVERVKKDALGVNAAKANEFSKLW